MTKKVSSDEWQSLIKKQEKSGKSQAEWCRNTNISVKAFGYWSRKLRNNSSSTENDAAEINWIPLNLDEKVKKTAKLNIRVGSAVIEIESGFDYKLLSEAVKALASIC